MLKNGARIVVDIGDSNFAGVHVPTDEFLIKIADKIGLELIDTELVRKRTSNDGTPLKQVLLTFEKRQSVKRRSALNSIVSGKEEYKTKAEAFEKELPYKQAPYDSRNWGHSLHSLCSYQGKLKPALAHFLVQFFTNVGDTVLDPLSGAGTIPLEAFLTGRKAIANDLQELGYILSSAKVGKPSPDKVIKELYKLLAYIANNKDSLELDVEKHKNFGLNGKIFEYFHEDNLREIFAARQYLSNNKCNSVERALVYSSLLHILHGNRPYALSRTSHPVTPFKPSGEYTYKDIKERLYAKISRSLEAYEGDSIIDGSAWLGSYQDLKLSNQIDVIITSPPFAESTRFYSANWLRLWMAGWEPEDFKDKKIDFLEEKQKKNLDIYSDFFDRCHEWLKPNGKLILHLGKTKKVDMAQELIKRCGGSFDVVHAFDEDVVNREKFGIKDQGATVAHQYLFLMKK
jgi:DNA modification methylase